MQTVYVIFRQDADLSFSREDSALVKHLGYFTDLAQAQKVCDAELARTDALGLDYSYSVISLEHTDTISLSAAKNEVVRQVDNLRTGAYN